jgi:hypothetical protein
LPAWASSLACVAAGVLAGEGDREAMQVLVEAFRSGGQAHGFAEAAAGAHTEPALPLWAEVLEDADEAVREWAAGNVAGVESPRAATLLVSCLADASYRVRRRAALSLMARDRRESIPVLREVFERDFVGGVHSALRVAPICCKLQQWQVADVPWPRIESLLDERASRRGIRWHAIQLAGDCLSAGREQVALPFLKAALKHPEEATALHAARTLLASGSSLGLDRIARHVAAVPEPWLAVWEDLSALAAFLARGAFSRQEWEAAVAIARSAFRRCRAQGRGDQLLRPLGEMGALYGVQGVGDAVRIAEVVGFPYTLCGNGTSGRAMRAIFQAKVRSVVVSAQHQGIELPPGVLEEFKRSQVAAISTLARTGGPRLAEQATNALKLLQESSTD